MQPTHFSLFSGVGGLDLACDWAGFRTVGQCEIADYPYKILCKHWLDVPKWRDIREVTAESVRQAGIGAINLLTGGDPCQPHSLAGKRLGMEDERFLWPEMFRVIKDTEPAWVVNENVPGSISNGVLLKKIYDLESEGYICQSISIPAYAVGAVHIRKRIFLLAYSFGNGRREVGSREPASSSQGDVANANNRGCGESWKQGSMARISGKASHDTMQAEKPSAYVADSDNQGLQGYRELRECAGQCFAGSSSGTVKNGRQFKSRMGGIPDGSAPWIHRPVAPFGCEQYDWEPPRLAKGIKNRRQRLECLGAMVMPQQCYPILKAIYDIETR